MSARSMRRSMSDPHMAPIGLPEAADRGLRGPRVGALYRIAAHLDDRVELRRPGDPPLDEASDDSVLHRHEARRPDEIRLLQSNAPLLARVVAEAEIGPIDLGLIDTLGHDPAHGDRVLHLGEGAARKHRNDLQRDAVAEFIETF